MSDRFPMPPYPQGWYVVAHSAEIPVGQVVPLRRFGQELVAYRGESGEVRVMDAHCPHLGANIGYGGMVRGDDIVCPFHHWRFDRDGRNVDIPYRDTFNRRAQLRAWPVDESNGTVMVWLGHEDEQPTWQVPRLKELDDEAYLPPIPGQSYTIRTHVQEIIENVVDMAHFRYIHGVKGFGALEVVEDGPMLRATAAITFGTPRGLVDGYIENEVWGLGVNFNRPVGLIPTCAIATQTPIEDGLVDFRYTFIVPRKPGTDEPSNASKSFMKDYHFQIEQDIPVWEHKIYRESPKLARGEGAVADLRRWASQFYAKADA
ncbi:Rieske 2Fe-2S domain-containing protein [Nakamurella sp. YIM 132087]|uniref:cholesterol 7-desaturase n=1 Tax=Nakamurella alba TaxID=2665158 RepID=A0A7K1FLD9_9ACTN|nr:Rieske 2Fe-2S domain-containing protein [Nakamurella alba]MTD14043.1 Rieske 2Fe-2S domain-containing protein [Nakamurella alba]